MFWSVTLLIFASAPSFLIAVDISTPENPLLISSLPLKGTPIPGCAAVFGEKVFVGTDRGVEVIDVGDPRSPRMRDFLPLDGVTGRLLTIGGYLYVPTSEGLFVVDLGADPPRLSMREGPRGYERMPIAQLGRKRDIVWALDRHRYIHLISTSNPAEPELMGSSAVPRDPVFFRLSEGDVEPLEKLNLSVELMILSRGRIACRGGACFLLKPEEVDLDEVIGVRRGTIDRLRIAAISRRYLVYWDHRSPDSLWILPRGGAFERLDLADGLIEFISSAGLGGVYPFKRRIVVFSERMWGADGPIFLGGGIDLLVHGDEEPRGRNGAKPFGVVDILIRGDEAYVITDSGELVVVDLPKRRITRVFAEPSLRFRSMEVKGETIYIAAVRRG